MRLEDVQGQNRAIAVLRRALAAGRLAHAYLFDGPDGVGKRTAAQALGLALLCPISPGSGCGTCETCGRIGSRNHPDLMVVDAVDLPDLVKASSEKSAVKYAARFLFPYALSPPHEGAARILIIDHADELSPDVQNTLLKTLEEPRPSIHIVLATSARDRLLPTILSRTQRIRFAALSHPALVAIAERQKVAPERAAIAAALAGGSASRLLALAGAEGDIGPFNEVAELRKAAASPRIGSVFDAAMAFGDKESKGRLPDILALLAGLQRDALVSAAGAPELAVLGEHRQEIDAIVERADRAGGDPLAYLRRDLRAVLDAQAASDANVNAVALLEQLLLQLGRHTRPNPVPARPL